MKIKKEKYLCFMEHLLDLYTDYLLSSTGITTATGLSRLREGDLSHDKISRLLSGHDFTSKDLWRHEYRKTCLQAIFDCPASSQKIKK
jgi:hypothetical protein